MYLPTVESIENSARARLPEGTPEAVVAMTTRLLLELQYTNAETICRGNWVSIVGVATALSEAQEYTHPGEISRRIRNFAASF